MAEMAEQVQCVTVIDGFHFETLTFSGSSSERSGISSSSIYPAGDVTLALLLRSENDSKCIQAQDHDDDKPRRRRKKNKRKPGLTIKIVAREEADATAAQCQQSPPSRSDGESFCDSGNDNRSPRYSGEKKPAANVPDQSKGLAAAQQSPCSGDNLGNDSIEKICKKKRIAAVAVATTATLPEHSPTSSDEHLDSDRLIKGAQSLPREPLLQEKNGIGLPSSSWGLHRSSALLEVADSTEAGWESSSGRWTTREDARLREALGGHSMAEISWEYVASIVRRKIKDCKERWYKVLEPGFIRGRWSEEEDQTIIACLSAGMTLWSDVAKKAEGRTGKQCRERFTNNLDPTINKGAWTETEDAVLELAHGHWGNGWSKVARALPGRSVNMVKNRWHSAAFRKWKASNCMTKQLAAHASSVFAAAVSNESKRASYYSDERADHILPRIIEMCTKISSFRHAAPSVSVVGHVSTSPVLNSDSDVLV